MDLEVVLCDFEDYYETRFGKKPKVRYAVLVVGLVPRAPVDARQHTGEGSEAACDCPDLGWSLCNASNLCCVAAAQGRVERAERGGGGGQARRHQGALAA